jgi:hypothetical protein
LQLQQAFIEAVAPYTEPNGTAAAYVTTPDHPDINAATLKYVNAFIRAQRKELQPTCHNRRWSSRFCAKDEDLAIR